MILLQKFIEIAFYSKNKNKKKPHTSLAPLFREKNAIVNEKKMNDYGR